MMHRSTVVLGAGPTGLSAAFHLGNEAILVDRERRVGGWCRSVECRGFTFDMAGHIMFSNDPYVHQLYRMCLGDNVHWQDREAWIYSKGTYTRYPFQGALYGLPPDVVRECLLGAMEARYGLWQTERETVSNGRQSEANSLPKPFTNGAGRERRSTAALAVASNGDARHTAQLGFPSTNGSVVTDCCADGITEAGLPLCVPSRSASPAEPRNFEEFIYRVWGKGIARHFAIPYNRKLWTVPLDQMETSWLGGRVPMPDLGEMIEGALVPSPKPMGPNARFGYPLRGGFQALMDGFLPHLRSELLLDREAVRVLPAERRVWFDNGSHLVYDWLISTIPLPELIRLIGDQAPAEVHQAATKLKRVSVRCVNLGIGRPAVTEKHWIYYPEDTVFHRIFVQGNASPHCNPPGGFGLTCEITYSHWKPLPADGEALTQRCIDDCRRVGLIREDDPVWASCQVDLPYAYVVYDHDRRANVELIRAWLAQRRIILAGRYSEWEYYNSDHAFLAGRRAGHEVVQARAAEDGGAEREEIDAAVKPYLRQA